MGRSGAAVIVMLLVASWASAQISPGALSRPHSFLRGAMRCTDCHDIGKSPPRYKCLECHKDIRQRLEQQSGLHPSLVGQEREDRACVKCHSEHHGMDFSLIYWDPPLKEFDHARTKYFLEGKHAKVECRSCHQPSNIPDAEAITLSTKDLKRTYLGLSRECRACHFDEHRGQLPLDCERCHNATGWKGVRLDHSKARFPLAGAHEKVACEKCHKRVEDPKPYTKYTGLAFEECTPCHQDPHRGAFKPVCTSCHSTANWKPSRVNTVFDHGATSYSLEGKHASLSCDACHQKADFKKPVAHAKCLDCHKKDDHRGQFKSRADRGECAACHDTAGFKPSTYNVAEHAKSKYPLEERHADVACGKCHIPKGPDTVYRIKDTRCISCHEDVHQKQFSAQPYADRCESCHTIAGFTPSTFSLKKHQNSRFPLTGAHVAIVCKECHKSPGSAPMPLPVRYSFNDRTCTACHEDPHRGQFVDRTTVRPDATVRYCDSCHNTNSWSELPGFDHAATSFPLKGTHESVACDKCHKPGNLEISMKNVIFNDAPRRCSECHEDIHGGQFSTETNTSDCAACHRILKWKPSIFDHERDSTFSLAGAHKAVRCLLCHDSTREVNGRSAVVYKPTLRECAACHGTEEIRAEFKSSAPVQRQQLGVTR